MNKRFVFLVICLLCLSICVSVLGEKKERLIWMAVDVPGEDQYIMYSDFDDDVKRTPTLSGDLDLLQAIGCEPGAYYVVTKGYVRTPDWDMSRIRVDVMHYDGETYSTIIENLTLDHCKEFVAYFNGFLYYIKAEIVVEEGKKATTFFLMRTRKGMLPETIAEITDSTPNPIISAHGDLLYFDINDAIGYSRIVHVSSVGEEIIAEGEQALWLDSHNILYVNNDFTLCHYNLEKKESKVFLDAAGRPIQMPVIYGAITLNKAKDTLAYFVERPQEETPAEYSELFQRKPCTVSLITGEHQFVEGAQYTGYSDLMTWWGE